MEYLDIKHFTIIFAQIETNLIASYTVGLHSDLSKQLKYQGCIFLFQILVMD